MRAATTGELRTIKALAAAGLHKAAIARVLGRDRGFVCDWAARLNLEVKRWGPGPAPPNPDGWRLPALAGIAEAALRRTMEQLHNCHLTALDDVPARCVVPTTRVN